MAGLLDLLLAAPGPEERLMQVLPMMSAGGPDPRSSADLGSSAPPGKGIFGNESVDVLDPNDPRLVDRFGVTLARPAMRSLTDVLRELGFHGDAGGGYRSPQGQANIYAAKPGLAAPPGSSYHQEGLAIDLAAALQNARASQLLRQAGWNQFSPGGEPWHWSYGVTG